MRMMDNDEDSLFPSISYWRTLVFMIFIGISLMVLWLFQYIFG